MKVWLIGVIVFALVVVVLFWFYYRPTIEWVR